MQLLSKTCIFALGLLLCATVAFAETTGKQHDSPIQTLEDYNRAILGDPDNAELYKKRGTAYKKLGQYNNALDDFSRAIRLNANDAGCYYDRGNIYRKLRRYRRAIEDFNQAIRLAPDNARAYNYRGIVYKNIGR
jgi:tetratricopeptide (TPR) repeat protein